MGHCEAIVGVFFFPPSFFSITFCPRLSTDRWINRCTQQNERKFEKFKKVTSWTRASTFDWRFNYRHLNFNSRDKSHREKPSFFFRGWANGFSWQIHYIPRGRSSRTR